MKSGHPEKSRNHQDIPPKHQPYKSIKINPFEIKMRSYSSNMVVTRITPTVEKILFSTLLVRGWKEARLFTWPVDLGS